MSNRRRFLSSVTAGSAAYLVGCGPGEPVVVPDGGLAPCRPVPPAEPPALDYPAPSYFDQLSMDLDAAGVGTPVVFIDMDRMDDNIDEIASAIGPDRFRIVEKSLPSLDLLSYVSARSTSERFLSMHLPFLSALLTELPGAQVLVGKTHRTAAVREFFSSQPASTDLAALAARVTFLADGPTRLAELAALASSLGVTLRVAVEIDVGLRRSGVNEPTTFSTTLAAFGSSSSVRFAGLLGYDGHVVHTPSGMVDEEWMAAQALYQSYVDILRTDFFSLAALPDLVFHGGGTTTYARPYASGPVNDVAAGGGVLRPGGYPAAEIPALRPAIFIATPVLRQYPAPQLPFFDAEQNARIFEDLQGLTIYGGGWPAFFTHPAGIQPAPFVSDPTDIALVPNQGMVTAPAATPIGAGDWIFYHPRQSDVLFQFEDIRLVRGGRLLTERMAAYPRRY